VRAGDERTGIGGLSTCADTEERDQRLKDALGKLYALCAMYQDMDFFLRPIIQDLEDLENAGKTERPGDCIPADAGGGLPRLTFVDSEVGGCQWFETGAGVKEVR
jgi:hypothetical protein